jgi:hypothetical protein
MNTSHLKNKGFNTSLILFFKKAHFKIFILFYFQISWSTWYTINTMSILVTNKCQYVRHYFIKSMCAFCAAITVPHLLQLFVIFVKGRFFCIFLTYAHKFACS